MTELNRRIDLGPLQVAGLQVVYENNLTKTYASYRSFVPENVLFLLGIEFVQPSNNKLIVLFGDQIGELVFLGAVSHTLDRNGLPTGILCMSVNAFNSWMFPIDSEQIKKPEIEDFCLCQTDEFLADSNTAEQKLLISNDKFKPSLKQFIQFMVELKLAIGKSSFDETFLGCKEVVVSAEDMTANNKTTRTNKAADTPANRNAKANLSEDEKLALQLGADGLRKSSRVAGPPKSLYGPSSRIPVGAFNLPKIPSNKMKQPETAPKDNRPNKKSSLNDKILNPPKITPSHIDNKSSNHSKITPPTSTPTSRLTKAQLLEEINSFKIANTTPVMLPPTTSIQLTQTSLNQLKPQNTKFVAEPTAKDDIASRTDYRAQGQLDFEQAESYAKSFYSFGKTMLTDFKGFHFKPDEQYELFLHLFY
jgi:hypothetical protein